MSLNSTRGGDRIGKPGSQGSLGGTPRSDRPLFTTNWMTISSLRAYVQDGDLRKLLLVHTQWKTRRAVTGFIREQPVGLALYTRLIDASMALGQCRLDVIEHPSGVLNRQELRRWVECGRPTGKPTV